MANISAHVRYSCLCCYATSEEDFFDLADESDFPDEIECPICGHVAYEDGHEVWVDGDQVDGMERSDFEDGESDDYCDQCGSYLSDRALDQGECGDCGSPT